VFSGVLIFAATYVVISARRLGWLGLDRPGGTLAGAVACVAFGVLSPSEALAAVDGSTLLLLFGMMGMGAFLSADEFFDRATVALAVWAATPSRLLGAVVWGSGGFAAMITNDAVCVLEAPLVVAMIQRYRLPPLPFLLALATAANTGSVATLVGNPQNMLCAQLGGLAYRDYLLLMTPVAIVGLAVNHVLLVALFRSQLGGRLEADAASPVITRQSAATLAVIGAAMVFYFAGADLAWTSVGGCVVLLIFHRQDPQEIWNRIDWSVLLFFAGLFVVVDGLTRSGVPAQFFASFPLWSGEEPASWIRLSAIFLFGSNIVSNVPFILLVRPEMATLPDPQTGWTLLAMASTLAGNLTLIGSVANIIVAEKGREVGGIGFWEYLRFGLPLSLLTAALGTAWLILMR
jgi:Na+/H+ antiporter NhaD/arsenite permease-like protein